MMVFRCIHRKNRFYLEICYRKTFLLKAAPRPVHSVTCVQVEKRASPGVPHCRDRSLRGRHRRSARALSAIILNRFAQPPQNAAAPRLPLPILTTHASQSNCRNPFLQKTFSYATCDFANPCWVTHRTTIWRTARHLSTPASGHHPPKTFSSHCTAVPQNNLHNKSFRSTQFFWKHSRAKSTAPFFSSSTNRQKRLHIPQHLLHTRIPPPPAIQKPKIIAYNKTSRAPSHKHIHKPSTPFPFFFFPRAWTAHTAWECPRTLPL